MSLLRSERLQPRDMEVWQDRGALDLRWARSPRHRAKVSAANRAIAEFLADGPAWAGVSWGKDSMVIAHLCAGACPLVWVRVEPIANPDCERVRDVFIAAHPAVSL